MPSPERNKSAPRQAIDREKTTPFLLRLFVQTGGFHKLEEFDSPDRLPVEDEVQIYTWKDVTLSELGRLISSAFPQVSRPNTRLAFRLLYTDSFRPRVLLKDIGSVIMSPGQENDEAGSRTLEDVKYVIGDWIDVAVFNASQGGPSRGFDGSRGGSFNRQSSGPGQARGDSYRGSSGRERAVGRNGFDGPSGDNGPHGSSRGGRW